MEQTFLLGFDGGDRYPAVFLQGAQLAINLAALRLPEEVQGFVEDLSDLVAGHVTVIEKAEYPVF